MPRPVEAIESKMADTPVNYMPLMVLPPFQDENEPGHIVIPPIAPLFESVVPYFPLIIAAAAVIALVIAGAIAAVVSGAVRLLIAKKARKIERLLRNQYYHRPYYGKNRQRYSRDHLSGSAESDRRFGLFLDVTEDLLRRVSNAFTKLENIN
ncbi:hypothetical protein QYM36_002059 [Artemia franciscana]|uniref:Uncharacterized protein n=1 Tax=Artemia franciscana TaxID=6661 RepID=A0AA88L9P3_ARTSF|nr:hypothetical protein QYM36_002059 [Artemia franciscana]